MNGIEKNSLIGATGNFLKRRVFKILSVALLLLCDFPYAFGNATVYYENQISCDQNYCVSGSSLIDGIVKSFYGSGRLRAETTYKYGERNGLETSYYESGKIKAKTNYADNKKNGYDISYYENGNMKSKVMYRHNLKNGAAFGYYTNGNLKFSVSYRNDVLNGKVKFFYENGKLKSDMMVKDGKRVGSVLEYDARGNLISQPSFDGEIIKDINNMSNSSAYVQNGQQNRQAENKNPTDYKKYMDDIKEFLLLILKVLGIMAAVVIAMKFIHYLLVFIGKIRKVSVTSDGNTAETRSAGRRQTRREPPETSASRARNTGQSGTSTQSRRNSEQEPQTIRESSGRRRTVENRREVSNVAPQLSDNDSIIGHRRLDL